ncbi:MAG: helix-turn-helix domain-containing protein [Blautia sp.]|uniref:helix-turn-helix domain-containing protein n=1 Tax=Blautia glucerasea TaxID=536633 RepID=UPI00156F6952|nr:helix-turn-helix transcriptional regulator [Blautia glucerasea]NSJ28177.1 helix-turn-helix transcriptional regulator [Blautia glucerasea]
MAVSYNRLFKLMIDKKMRKKDLCELVGVSTSTMSKMGRDEIVSLEVIDRICQKLNCGIEDVLEILPDSSDNGTSKNVK